MSLTNIIGLLMLVAIFGAILCYGILTIGIKAALVVIGIVLMMTVWIGVAVILITKDKNS